MKPRDKHTVRNGVPAVLMVCAVMGFVAYVVAGGAPSVGGVIVHEFNARVLSVSADGLQAEVEILPSEGAVPSAAEDAQVGARGIVRVSAGSDELACLVAGDDVVVSWIGDARARATFPVDAYRVELWSAYYGKEEMLARMQEMIDRGGEARVSSRFRARVLGQSAGWLTVIPLAWEQNSEPTAANPQVGETTMVALPAEGAERSWSEGTVVEVSWTVTPQNMYTVPIQADEVVAQS